MSSYYGRERALLSLEVIEARPAPEWLIHDILPEGGSSLLSGKYSTGKSFGAVGMGMCVAANKPWHGHAVQQGSVVYVAAEGAAGMGRRTRAWKKENNITEPIPFWFIDMPVNLLDEKDVTCFIALVKPIAPKAVFLDTLARCMPGGDENGSRDGGILIESVERIRRTLNCQVVLVHHMGWAGSHSRGSTTIPAAVDTEIHVSLDGEFVKVHCEKQKDSERFGDFTMLLKKVRLSDDPNDTSCVWEGPLNNKTAQEPPKAPRKTVTDLRRPAALDRLRSFGEQGATFMDWFRKMGSMPKTSFDRLTATLVASGEVIETAIPKANGKDLITYTLAEFTVQADEDEDDFVAA